MSTRVPERFQFPHFRQLMWFAAAQYVDRLKGVNISICSVLLLSRAFWCLLIIYLGNLNALDKWERDSAMALRETLSTWFLDPGKIKDIIKSVYCLLVAR